MSETREKFCIGNWKCNGNLTELVAWGEQFKPQRVTSVLCPPAPYLIEAVKLLAGKAQVGCQDIAAANGGALTGQISAAMAINCKVTYTLVGHSECRAAGQTDEQFAAKINCANEVGLRVIYCIGETKPQRDEGKLEEILSSQLTAVAEQIKAAEGLIVAYEPVWAIGTGVTATAADAQSAISYVRQQLTELGCSDKIPLLYGGSVKVASAGELFAQAAVDGLLVGGASLDAEQFTTICVAAT